MNHGTPTMTNLLNLTHTTPGPLDTDLTNLGSAFTKDGKVKHFWNLPGSEGEPSGPAPPGAENELIPNGTLEPTTASWQADPVEEELPLGLHWLVPFWPNRGVSAD